MSESPAQLELYKQLGSTLDALQQALSEQNTKTALLMAGQETIKKDLDQLNERIFTGDGNYTPLDTRVKLNETKIKTLKEAQSSKDAQESTVKNVDRQGKWQLVAVIISAIVAASATIIAALIAFLK